MRFDVTILGSNSALPANSRFPSAQVLNVQERLYLIDCGEGTQSRLIDNKIRKSRIHQIFISHLHGDHIFGLIGLLTTMSLMGRREKLMVLSPFGLEEIINVQLHHSQAHLDFELEFVVLDTTSHQLIFQDSVVQVFSFPLAHRIPTCGFLFREVQRKRNIRPECLEQYQIPISKIEALKDGKDLTLENGQIINNAELTQAPYHSRTFAYCSDTSYLESLVPIIKGVDLLYHETTFLHERLAQALQTKHSTALQAATLAKKAAVGQLITGHYSSRYKDLSPILAEAQSVFPNTQLGMEGKNFSVPLYRREEE